MKKEEFLETSVGPGLVLVRDWSGSEMIACSESVGARTEVLLVGVEGKSLRDASGFGDASTFCGIMPQTGLL